VVAGDLGSISDSFKTMSGRNVALHVYSEKHNVDKLAHSMDSLKKAMKWDEDTFGREYDLDIFNIVAVDDFNMGGETCLSFPSSVAVSCLPLPPSLSPLFPYLRRCLS